MTLCCGMFRIATCSVIDTLGGCLATCGDNVICCLHIKGVLHLSTIVSNEQLTSRLTVQT